MEAGSGRRQEVMEAGSGWSASQGYEASRVEAGKAAEPEM
jgi:hypothetical protein